MAVSILTKKIVDLEDYDVDDQKIIDEGTGSLIGYAKNRRTNDLCAIKDFTSQTFTIEQQKYFIREVCAFAAINHPAAIELKGFSLPSTDNDGFATIFLEYAPNGNLKTAIEEEPEWFDITSQMIIIAGVVGVVSHFHANGLVHRDLKPSNVVIDAEYHPKLCDFGLARQASSDPKIQGTLSAANNYMAPEAKAGAPPAPSMDVFVLGVLIFEIITKRYPFEGISFRQIVTGQRPPIPSSIPEPLANIIQECWDNDPSKRPTAHQILQVLSRKDAVPSKVDWDKYKDYYDMIFEHTDPFMSETTRQLRIKCNLGDSVDWYRFAMQLLKDDPMNPRAQKLAKEYLQNASKDFYMASYQLGLMSIADREYEKAFEYFKKGAEKEHPESIHQYALCFKNGRGTDTDLDTAEELLFKAGQLGNIDAYVDYAKLIIERNSSSEKNREGKEILAALYQYTERDDINDLLNSLE